MKLAIATEEIAKLNYHSLLISKKIKKLDDNDVKIMHNYYVTDYGNK